MGSDGVNQKSPRPSSHDFSDEEIALAEQLLNLRRNPNPVLKQRIRAIPTRQTEQRSMIRQWARALAAGLLLIFLFASPPAQATLGQVEKIIGQIRLTVQDTYQHYAATPTPINSRVMSLTEARATVPFKFALPTYLPDNLADEALISVTDLGIPLVKVRWSDTSGGFIQLTAHKADGQENLLSKTLIGTNSAEKIMINGKSAVMIRGGWDTTHQTWHHQEQITTIIWEAKGIQYRLLAYSTVLSTNELIVMAQSVP